MLKHLLIAFLATATLMATPAQAAVIKIATLTPEGSQWMNDMRAGAAEIKERTDGRVIVKFYGGGVMGSDKSVLRKIRVGQLHGATFIASGFVGRYDDLQIYSLPLLFCDLDEVDYVRKTMDPIFKQGLEDAGYKTFGFAEGGFAMLMSNVPVHSLEDLEGQKIWVPEGDAVSNAAMEALGLSPVVLPITDVMTGLQTGLIDIVASSSVAAVVFQWHTKVKYVTKLPITYLTATLGIEKRAFDKLNAEDQVIVADVLERIYANFNVVNRQDDEKAALALQSAGLEFVEPDPAKVNDWYRIVGESNRRMSEVKNAFSMENYQAVLDLLSEFRAQQAASVTGESR